MAKHNALLLSAGLFFAAGIFMLVTAAFNKNIPFVATGTVFTSVGAVFVALSRRAADEAKKKQDSQV